MSTPFRVMVIGDASRKVLSRTELATEPGDFSWESLRALVPAHDLYPLQTVAPTVTGVYTYTPPDL
jgi:hypothetical protein